MEDEATARERIKILALLNKIHFFHKVKIGEGVYTDGVGDMEVLRPSYIFDELDLVGKSVLDVGCWDGYFSFEAEKKGASRVVPFDEPSCRWGGMEGYNFLHNFYKSKAEFVKGNLYDLRNIFSNKEFDVVLCYGVMYHLSDPLFALQNLFHVCKDTIVFEGIFSPNEETPFLELIPFQSLCKDGGNLYAASVAYMKFVGEYNGFKLEKVKSSFGEMPIPRLNLLFKRVSDGASLYSDTSFRRYESK